MANALSAQLRHFFTNEPFTQRAAPFLIRSFCSKPAASGTQKDINTLVKQHDVVVFMKGVPHEPRCGFSNAVVQILRMHGVKDYHSVDVLEDSAIREGVKEYSNWPTVPQVFIKGEFVGGCDIMLEMHRSGDLIEELQKAGIRSVLMDKEPEKK